MKGKEHWLLKNRFFDTSDFNTVGKSKIINWLVTCFSPMMCSVFQES